jgi:hypothetical protein
MQAFYPYFPFLDKTFTLKTLRRFTFLAQMHLHVYLGSLIDFAQQVVGGNGSSRITISSVCWRRVGFLSMAKHR